MYATVADFVRRFREHESAELSDLDTAELSEDRSAILSALVDADSEIDGILGKRYVVPIKVPNRLLTAYSCKIARHYLYRDLNEKVAKEYDDSIARLEEIANGNGDIEGATEKLLTPEQGLISAVYPTTYISTRWEEMPTF